MEIHSADELLHTLRGCGLFTPERFAALTQDLARAGGDPPALMRHLVQHDWISVYQLRKVIHGKAAELFIGPYVIVDKVGEGGMGRVYRARQVRDDREVALKIVRSNLLSNPVVRGRYEREARAAAALRHPNIVTVLDAGTADGKCYLAMEFVDGVDLARLLRQYGVLSLAEAAEYVRQAALGLQHAHDLGFIHRDVKPSNVVVSGERHIPKAKGPAHVQILDMGLVRAVGLDDGPGGTDLTRAGTVVGTPDYMAPEQARNSSTVDLRADLYSLGCTFFFLLTGRPPFPDGTPIEKLLKHQVDPPPPLQLARPDVSNELAAVVARLMAKRPEQRFGSAREVATILEPFARLGTGAAPAPVPPALLGAVPPAAETLAMGGAKTLSPPETALTPAHGVPVPVPRPDGVPARRPRPPRGRSAAAVAVPVATPKSVRPNRAGWWLALVAVATLLAAVLAAFALRS